MIVEVKQKIPPAMMKIICVVSFSLIIYIFNAINATMKEIRLTQNSIMSLNNFFFMSRNKKLLPKSILFLWVNLLLVSLKLLQDLKINHKEYLSFLKYISYLILKEGK